MGLVLKPVSPPASGRGRMGGKSVAIIAALTEMEGQWLLVEDEMRASAAGTLRARMVKGIGPYRGLVIEARQHKGADDSYEVYARLTGRAVQGIA